MLKKRLAHNLGANLFAQFTTVLVQLAGVPIFLSFWSKEHYGAWLLISTIPAYLALGEAGFATTSANEVSMALAQGDRLRARRSLHTAWGFLVGISIALLALTLMSFLLLPWQSWLRVSTVTSDDLRWTILLLGIYTILGILIAIFGTLYRAAHKNARNVYLASSARLAELIAVTAGVVCTSSFASIAGLMLGVRLISFMIYFLDSKKMLENMNLGISCFSVAELKRSWRPSVMFMAATLGNALYLQGLTLLVGAMLGPTAVVLFNTTRTFSRVICQFVMMIKYSIMPEFSHLFGAGDLVRARRLNELSFESSWLASVGLAVVIFFTAPWIMPLWTHHAVQIDPCLLAVFLASAVLNGVWFVTSGLLMGTNQHEGLTIRYLLLTLLGLGFGAGSVMWLGIYGIALAMVLVEAMLLPYALTRTCQLLHQPLKEFIVSALLLKSIRKAVHSFYRRRYA